MKIIDPLARRTVRNFEAANLLRILVHKMRGTTSEDEAHTHLEIDVTKSEMRRLIESGHKAKLVKRCPSACALPSFEPGWYPQLRVFDSSKACDWNRTSAPHLHRL